MRLGVNGRTPRGIRLPRLSSCGTTSTSASSPDSKIYASKANHLPSDKPPNNIFNLPRQPQLPRIKTPLPLCSCTPTSVSFLPPSSYLNCHYLITPIPAVTRSLSAAFSAASPSIISLFLAILLPSSPTRPSKWILWSQVRSFIVVE